jgi:hypothetical protein
MRNLLTFSLFLTALVFPVTPVARAAWPHQLGRHGGHGWSDGYHARNHCPPRRNPTCPHCSPPAPWWAIPAAEPAPQVEPLPPAAGHARYYPGQPAPPRGPSLFRQAGEGSSVLVTGHAAAGL